PRGRGPGPPAPRAGRGVGLDRGAGAGGGSGGGAARGGGRRPHARPGARGAREVWQAGRRALEHEFGKVQRYRSIRDLSSGDPGRVVAMLRPIWLMSPTSVSDTLPLDPDLFDVVIYDEASQIPVEEAVP